jgi:hypothetical protein
MLMHQVREFLIEAGPFLAGLAGGYCGVKGFFAFGRGNWLAGTWWAAVCAAVVRAARRFNIPEKE